VSDLDERSLHAWLATHVDGVDGDAPMTVGLISGGASNVTLAVTVGDRELVVRHPPATAFLPTANDVGREFRFYDALADTPVPTPRPFAHCEDASVIGAPFFVMERLHGIVPHDPEPLEGMTADEGRALCDHLVDVLTEIHAVDHEAVGLGDVGRPTGYLERQVRRWTDQWHRAKAADDPVIDELARRLGEAIPASPPATVVHGDYRLGNVMVDADDRTRIVGHDDVRGGGIGHVEIDGPAIAGSERRGNAFGTHGLGHLPCGSPFDGDPDSLLGGVDAGAAGIGIDVDRGQTVTTDGVAGLDRREAG